MADKVQLDRVMGNILGNALKYIPSGSSVTVSTKAAVISSSARPSIRR